MTTVPGSYARQRSSDEGGGRFTGVVNAIVTNNNDPDSLGRVKVKFPWMSDSDESPWARIAAPMAGSGRGAYFLPEVDDEVLVAFFQGDPRFPYVIGALWSSKDPPPADNSNGKNTVRVIKSPRGHQVRFDDESGKELVEIIDASGKNRIVIDIAHNTITLQAAKDIVIAAPQGTLKLTARKVTVESSTDTTITAHGSMQVKADSVMAVQGSTVNIN
jgi:uncharacterized protein involved in type VI secretion and phage assembly